jgi:hypothetical protein
VRRRNTCSRTCLRCAATGASRMARGRAT